MSIHSQPRRDNDASQACISQRRDRPPLLGTPGCVALPALVASTQWLRAPRMAAPVIFSDSPPA